ncbi:MAG: cobalamin-dependent protein [Planctomycetes bacterium]|nr:cobalamin-dependent protein [Planctomycetota bacterium]
MIRPDLLLINPGGRKRIYQGLSTNLSAVESPIWVGLMAEHARRRGFSVEVLDANALELDPTEAAQHAVDCDALLTAVVVYGHNPNASTHTMPAAGDVCRAIKRLEPAQNVLLVGGHVAALPERTLREEEVDFTCSGEGPVTIADLLGALKEPVPELDKVRGLVWSDCAVIRRNEPAPIVTDLVHDMPGMAWDLLPMERYRAHNWHCFGGRERQPYAALYTTLGCPFRCTFCCIQAPFKSGEAAAGLDPKLNSYRRFDPEAVVAQIDWLANEHGVSNIKIADELFVLHKQHVTAICDGLAELGHDLNIWAYARVDTCYDDAMLATLRRAGVRWLAIGIESASEHVRDGVAKGYRPDKLMATLDRVRDHGIHVIGNYIFGLPDDDAASMRETLDFAKAVNTEFANFFSAMAYPGSALYGEALANGLELPTSWGGYSQHSRDCTPLPTKHLSSAEVLAFRDAAFHEYFERPEYLALVERTFGSETVEDIRAMTAHALPRDLLATTGV